MRILTASHDSAYINAAIELGALGYVLKSCLGRDLVAAMKAALANTFFVSRRYDE
jgi:DNA-binding NarL/FixJ family response regulator